MRVKKQLQGMLLVFFVLWHCIVPIFGNEADSFDKLAEPEPAITDVQDTVDLDTINNNNMPISSDAAMAVPFAETGSIGIINAPFYVANSKEENVSLNSGDLSYQKTLLSLPGRNGLDLDITMRYFSEDTWALQREFDNSGYQNQENYFGLGWNLNFTRECASGLEGQLTSNKCVRFPDGRRYETYISQHQLVFGNYSLEDMSIATGTLPNSTESCRIISYKDGKKEYLDGSGYLLRIEDRFQNSIVFEYQNISYYQGNLTDYATHQYYAKNLRALSKITDSLGRVITVHYTLDAAPEGKRVSQIQYRLNNQAFSTVYLKRVKSANGPVDLVDFIMDAEGYTTHYSYSEKTIRYYQKTSTAQSANMVGTCFLMDKITYPTGAESTYEYAQYRRSSFDYYCVSRKKDSSGTSIAYSYQNTSYPYYTLVETSQPDVPTNQQLYRFDWSRQIVETNQIDTAHCFQSYAPGSIDSLCNVYCNGAIYRCGFFDNMLVMFKQNADGGLQFKNAMGISKEVGEKVTAKVYGKRIYVFFINGSANWASKVFRGAVYDTTNDTWYTAGYLNSEDKNIDPSIMQYVGGKFFAVTGQYSIGNNDKKEITFYEYAPGSNQFVEYKTGQGAVYDANGCVVSASANKIYVFKRGSIYAFDANTHTTTSLYASNVGVAKGGFVSGNYLYVYGVDASTRQGPRLSKIKLASDGTPTAAENIIWLPAMMNGFFKDSSGTLYMHADDALYQFHPADETVTKCAQLTIDAPYLQCVASPVAIYCFYSKYPANKGSEQNYIPIEVIHPQEEQYTRIQTTYAYQNRSQLIKKEQTVHSPGGQSRSWSESYEWDKKDNLLSATDRLGNKTKTEYDATYSLPTKTTKFADTENAQVTNYTLDADKKNITSVAAVYSDRTLTTAYAYGDASHPGNVTGETLTETKGSTTTTLRTTSNEYSAAYQYGYLTKQTVNNVMSNDASFTYTNLGNYSSSYTYDMASGRVLTATDALGRTTTYQYNKIGWPTKVTNPDGTSETTTYELNPDTGVNSITKRYTSKYAVKCYYDSLGRITKNCKLHGSREVQRLTYAYTGQYLDHTLDANGNKTAYQYDGFGRVVKTTLSNESTSDTLVTAVTFDDHNMSKTTNTGGRTATEFFDIAERPIKTEVNTAAGLAQTLTQYDERGNVASVTDANGNLTTYTYDDRGLMLSAANALCEVTRYQYDGLGNVTSMLTPGNSTIRYQYDTLGRRIQTTDALNQSEYTAYDAVGNVIAGKDRNGTITTFTYKPNTNYVETKTAGTDTVSYTYNDFGSVLSMTDSTGTTEYTYTYSNSLSSITTPDGMGIFYTHDALEQITKVLDYEGENVTYQYGLGGRLDSVSGPDVTAQYAYNADGSLQSITYPGAGSSEFTYDNAGRVTALTNRTTDGAAFANYTYQYDLNGNQLKKTEILNGKTGVTDYEYDDLNRLVCVTEPDGTAIGYTFNQRGNVITKSIIHSPDATYTFMQNGTEHTIGNLTAYRAFYTYDANNRILTERETLNGEGDTFNGPLELTRQYSYDANGNTTKIETYGQVDPSVVQCTYDVWNNMTKYAKDGAETTYTYDGTGARLSKTTGGDTRYYYWDRGYLAGEGTEDDFTMINTIGLGGVIARKHDGASDVLFKNAHGDVTATVTDGAVVHTYDYDAYGVEKNPDPTDTNPFRYCGEVYDSESGNIYLRNRYYNPSIGRFTQEDPIKDGGNWYLYCGGNPITFVDPLGLFDYNSQLSVKSGYDPDIIALQKKLSELGYYSGELDGKFGELTLNAVNSYKEDNNLWNFDQYWGVVGLTTWQHLGLIYRTQQDIDNGVTIYTEWDGDQYFDVTTPLNNKLYEIGTVAEMRWRYDDSLTWFLSQVNHGKPWDIKREGPWKQTLGITYPGSYDSQVILHGKFVTPEQLGNMTYGYIGAALGLSLPVLYAGSFAAALPMNRAQFNNEMSDHPAIKEGYDWYKRK